MAIKYKYKNNKKFYLYCYKENYILTLRLAKRMKKKTGSRYDIQRCMKNGKRCYELWLTNAMASY